MTLRIRLCHQKTFKSFPSDSDIKNLNVKNFSRPKPGVEQKRVAEEEQGRRERRQEGRKDGK